MPTTALATVNDTSSHSPVTDHGTQPGSSSENTTP